MYNVTVQNYVLKVVEVRGCSEGVILNSTQLLVEKLDDKEEEELAYQVSGCISDWVWWLFLFLNKTCLTLSLQGGTNAL